MNRHPLTVLSLVLWVGCLPVPDTSNPLAVDGDGDGFSMLDGDCDDADPLRQNGRWYVDEDADGHFGGEPILSCERVEGRSETNDDCDDSDPATFVGVAAEDRSACMRDLDGDGFGDAAPSNAGVTAGTDCDDARADVWPGAAVNEPALCTVDEDGDGWGADTLRGSDCDDGDATMLPLDEDGDGYSLCDNDCDDTNSYLHPYSSSDGGQRCGWKSLTVDHAYFICAVDSDDRGHCWGGSTAQRGRELNDALAQLERVQPVNVRLFPFFYGGPRSEVYAVSPDGALAFASPTGAEVRTAWGNVDFVVYNDYGMCIRFHSEEGGWFRGCDQDSQDRSSWLNSLRIAKLSAGRHNDGSYMCALDRAGVIECRGNLPSGAAVAEGTYIDLAVRRSAGGSSQVVVCAIEAEPDETNGELRCFGEYARLAPTLRNATSVAISGSAICALDDVGQAHCGGSRTIPSSENPPDDVQFMTIEAGYEFFCGIRKDGGLSCWGESPYGAEELF